MNYIDLFCGIGGFHVAANNVARKREKNLKCVFASDIDPACQRVYKANFGLAVAGDITKIPSEVIPDHDLLFAGFPCQPFSIIGGMRGFEDTRGTLFFEIARILEAKQPKAFILENVKMLVGHQQGRTVGRIMESLRDLGYAATYRVLNALDFGLPQKRERVLIVGFRTESNFLWPEGGLPITPLEQLLESDVAEKYYASARIRESRQAWHKAGEMPTIWHENKSGNISKHPYSCALRAGASYNYLLVDGERRLTEREMLRLQGFPEEHQVVVEYGEARKQAGNSVPVPVIEAVLDRLLDAISGAETSTSGRGQYELVLERRRGYGGV